MKVVRIALAVLIVIGTGLLLTQNWWVPKLTDAILQSNASNYEPLATLEERGAVEEKIEQQVPADSSPTTSTEVVNPFAVTYQESGGKLYETKFEDNFQIGPFSKIVDVQKLGEESICDTTMKQIIIGAIKDMQAYMESRAVSFGYTKDRWYAFSINDETLDILCGEQAAIILTDDGGNILYIQKPPFVKGEQPNVGEGTFVRINAALRHAGDPAPSAPDEYGQLFLPDKLQKSQ